MKTSDHHLYFLDSLNGDRGPQELQFIHKVPVAEGSVDMKTLRDGTTNEEVCRVLLDRLNYMNAKFPCRENAVAITHIETALLWLEHRTRSRVSRGVEGKATA